MRSFFAKLLLISASFLGLISCHKDIDNAIETEPVINTAPYAVAGHDLWLLVPADTVELNGAIADDENNIAFHRWKQISGASNAVIVAPNNLSTKVRNLQKGDYQFELSVTDSAGLTSRDTVSVFIKEYSELDHGEVIFSKLEWYCDQVCAVTIECVSCKVPVKFPFKVFYKANVNQWIEIPSEENWKQGDKYFFGGYYDDLWIITEKPDSTFAPDIKVVY